MGGKIDCYLDIASYYSYIAFLELQKNLDILAAHSVQVEFHPVLLGAINAGSGNKPPWTLPAKATYGLYDGQRAAAQYPTLRIQFPDDLMTLGHTVLPLRALHHIKRAYPAKFAPALHYLFYCLWSPPNMDLTKHANLAKALSDLPVGFNGVEDPAGTPSDKVFSADEVKSIMKAAASQDMKDALKKSTQEALDQGAFGAPWLWVTDGKGEGEPFFGSDRFHYIYQFLELPFQDVKLLPPAKLKL